MPVVVRMNSQTIGWLGQKIYIALILNTKKVGRAYELHTKNVGTKGRIHKKVRIFKKKCQKMFAISASTKRVS